MPRGAEPESHNFPTDPPDPSYPVFTHAAFLAFLGAPPKYTRTGDIIFQLVVPYDQIPAAESLRHLVRNPVPIDVDMTIHAPYAEDCGDERLLKLIEGLGE